MAGMWLRGGRPSLGIATVFLVATLLAGSLPEGAQAVVLRAEAQVANSNPVRKVMEMLESMQKKVQEEGKHKEEIYDKYMCYCKKSTDSLNSQLAEAEKGLPQLRSREREVVALEATLNSEIEQHKKDREGAKSTMATAQELRSKESQTYLQESQNQKDTVDALTQAITALGRGQEGVFLQTDSASVLRRLSISADMTTRDRDILSSFLAEGSSASYQPATGQIMGMLKSMKEEMSNGLKEMTKLEQEKIAEHQTLMDASRKEQDAAMNAIEEKMMRLSELRIEVTSLQAEIKDIAEDTKETRNFALDMNKTCAEKEKAWADYSASQAEEIKLLSETVVYLDSDEVRDTLRAATRDPSTVSLSQRSTSSLQTASLSSDLSSQKPWLSFLQLASGGSAEIDRSAANQAAQLLHAPAGDKRLDLIELALRGQKDGLDEVMKKIDELHDVLDQEENSDREHKTYCNGQLRKVETAKADAERNIEDAKSIMATFQNELDVVNQKIQELQNYMKDLDTQVEDATKTRQEARADFVTSRNTNNAALDLFDMAHKRIERFYSSSFYQATHNSSQGRSAQQRSTRPEGIEKAPEANLEYRKSDSATELAIQFGKLKADIQKQTMMLQTEDDMGQAEYEGFVSNCNMKKSLSNKRLGSQQASRAELEATLQQSREDIRGHSEVLTAIGEEIQGLHRECDFLLTNFDIRRDARRNERQSLVRAKDVLQSAQDQAQSG